MLCRHINGVSDIYCKLSFVVVFGPPHVHMYTLSCSSFIGPLGNASSDWAFWNEIVAGLKKAHNITALEAFSERFVFLKIFFGSWGSCPLEFATAGLFLLHVRFENHLPSYVMLKQLIQLWLSVKLPFLVKVSSSWLYWATKHTRLSDDMQKFGLQLHVTT